MQRQSPLPRPLLDQLIACNPAAYAAVVERTYVRRLGPAAILATNWQKTLSCYLSMGHAGAV
jgi:hypothetical protein